MNPRLKRVTPVALALLLLALLSACAPIVALTPAAGAANPQCADVIVHLPHSIDDKPIRETDAQATSAWGDPATVVLRCGVTPPGPTKDPCYTVKGIDWVIDDSKDPVYTFTTYGRDPAVQLVITDGHGTIALDEVANAVGFLQQSGDHQCEDVLGDGTPGATPSPSPAP